VHFVGCWVYACGLIYTYDTTALAKPFEPLVYKKNHRYLKKGSSSRCSISSKITNVQTTQKLCLSKWIIASDVEHFNEFTILRGLPRKSTSKINHVRNVTPVCNFCRLHTRYFTARQRHQNYIMQPFIQYESSNTWC